MTKNGLMGKEVHFEKTEETGADRIKGQQSQAPQEKEGGYIMVEMQQWELSSLKDAGVVLIDCDHRTPPAAEIGYPYIAIPQLKNGRIDLSGVRKISATHFEEWTRKANPQHYDVILSRRCNPGETAHIPPNLKCALGQNLVLLRADGKKVLPQYLRWMTQGPLWWEQISKFINVGAVFDSLRCADVPKFELPLPPISEQYAIAAILEALDNKIELNQRMNDTLESIAQALFKSWFVDFDPVKANAEGRKPEGMDDSIAALFPSDFTDSTLGYIPLGWKVTPLADICENIFSGGTPSTQIANYWNGNVPWLSSGETRNRFIIHTEKTITEEGVANSSTRLVRCGCTVIAGAGQGHTRGQTSLLMLDSYINQSVVALKANPKISSDFFLFFDLTRRYEEFRQLSDSHSSRGSLTTKLLSGVKVVLPPAAVIQKFDDAARPVVAKIIANLHHSRTLANLRDIMLLHLISGKLRVGEISETVEALAL